MVPLSRYIYIIYIIYIYSNKFSCIIYLFKFDFSAFLNFHTEIYCVILSSCTESGSNAVHRMTSLLINVFPNSGPMSGPWVTGFPAQRASDTEIYLPACNTFCPVLFAHIRQTSNGSWCIGIKGEMSGTVCVTFTWDIYIYMSCL